MKIAYSTKLGKLFQGKAEDVIKSKRFKKYKGKIDLIFTSPPFALNRKKKYGNHVGEDYITWLSEFAPVFRTLLKPRGSVVIELGNAWESKRPIMSTVPLRALLKFLEAGQLVLCQQFIYHNPARLPSPAQWVTVKRIRVKDSFSHIWWMSASDRPKATNRRVLQPYSASMQRLLETQKYNSGKRPSGHNVGKRSFLRKHKGAIPPNVITVSNTQQDLEYHGYCSAGKLIPHPARMPVGVPEFFIKFLTRPNDLVLDPFSGSNTTGAVAEALGRKWLSIELDDVYIKGSYGRFTRPVDK
jgi:DNA modification methylase